MFKKMVGNVRPFLMACMQGSSIAHTARQRLTKFPTLTTTQRFLSQSPRALKEFSIKDHEEFDDKVLNNQNPVVVNFHADWCEPCEELTLQLKELLENSHDIDLAIIDVDANSELVTTFEVKAVPAILAFHNGMIVDKFIGLVEAERLELLIGYWSGQSGCTDLNCKGFVARGIPDLVVLICSFNVGLDRGGFKFLD